jgi:hypothetical protein
MQLQEQIQYFTYTQQVEVEDGIITLVETQEVQVVEVEQVKQWKSSNRWNRKHTTGKSTTRKFRRKWNMCITRDAWWRRWCRSVGTPGASHSGGPGGVGLSNSITGSPVFYAGGGGGGTDCNSPTVQATGGTGGGGRGGYGPFSRYSQEQITQVAEVEVELRR